MDEDQEAKINMAIHCNNPDKVIILLAVHGLSSTRNNGYYLLRNACIFNRTEICEYLLRMDCDVNCYGMHTLCDTPLHYSALFGNVKLVKLLLDKNAYINTKYFFSGLYTMSSNLNHIINKIKKYFNKSSARANTEPPFKIRRYDGPGKCGFKNFTPLHFAILSQNMEIVSLLLSSGANINSVGQHNETVLHVAAVKSGKKMLTHLINLGASVNAFTLPSFRYTEIFDDSLDIICPIFIRDVMDNPDEDYTPLHIATLHQNLPAVKCLLNKGANINAQNRSGKTALHIAVEKKNYELVKLLIRFKPDLINDGNNSALLDAIIYHPVRSIIEILCDYGFSIDLTNVDTIFHIYLAASKNQIEKIEYFLNYGVSVNTVFRQFEGVSLLHIATIHGYARMCEILLKHKADVNIKDDNDQLPIFYAIKTANFFITELLHVNGAKFDSNCIEALKFAIQRGCSETVGLVLSRKKFNLNVLDASGKFPLYYTAIKGHPLPVFTEKNCSQILSSEKKQHYTLIKQDKEKAKIVEILQAKGANINMRTSDGITTLETALENGFKAVAKILLKNNAKFNTTQYNKQLLLHLAVKNSFESIVCDLLNYGCDVNATDKNGNTPLHIACQKGHPKITALLVNHGANLFIKNKCNETAIFIACKSGHTRVVNELIKSAETSYSGNNSTRSIYFDLLHCKNDDKVTPLIIAAYNGFEHTVKVLLRSGCDPNCTDAFGRTALCVASSNGYYKIVEMLLLYGANPVVRQTDGLSLLESIKSIINRQEEYVHFFVNDNNINNNVIGGRVNSVGRKFNTFVNHKKVKDIILNYFNRLDHLYGFAKDDFLTSKSYDWDCSMLQKSDGEVCLYFKEICLMKSIGVYNNVTYYDIASKNVDCLVGYARNDDIVKVISLSNYCIIFPNYQDIIFGKFRTGLIRKGLVEKCCDVLYHPANKGNHLCQLPLVCFEKLLNLLSNDDLRVMLDAYNIDRN